MKAGTTTLYEDLKTVSGIFMPLEKESEGLVQQGVLTTEGRVRYASYFRECREWELAGDASTAYSKLPDYRDVPLAAHGVLGKDVKVIYLVRDPVRRLVSQHRHEYARGLMPRDIHASIDNYPRLISYSKYLMQAEPWIAQFGAEKVKFLSFERYVQNRRSVLEEVLAFLGVNQVVSSNLGDAHNVARPRIKANGIADRIVMAPLYRQRIRPLVPSRLRAVGGRLAATQLPPPTTLSPETEAELRRFFDQEIVFLSTLDNAPRRRGTVDDSNS